MAIYVADSTRRRRLVGIAVACLLVGLVAGGAVGRLTSPGVDDAVTAVRDHAHDAITTLERLPIEYEQSLAQEGGEDTGKITAALDRASRELDAAYAEIEVFGPTTRAATDAALDGLAQDVSDGASQDEFERAIGSAIVDIEATFGLAPDGAQD